MERTIRTLPVTLTPEEREQRFQSVARLSSEVLDAEKRIDTEKEAAKGRVKDAEAMADGLRARQRHLSRVALEGREDREVACIERLDRARRLRRVVRADTGALVEERPVDDEDITEGSAWVPNLPRNVAERIHPEEPALVLATRPLTPEERQQSLALDQKPTGEPAVVPLENGAPTAPPKRTISELMNALEAWRRGALLAGDVDAIVLDLRAQATTGAELTEIQECLDDECFAASPPKKASKGRSTRAAK